MGNGKFFAVDQTAIPYEINKIFVNSVVTLSDLLELLQKESSGEQIYNLEGQF